MEISPAYKKSKSGSEFRDGHIGISVRQLHVTDKINAGKYLFMNSPWSVKNI
jgi:hypothetical protein